MSQSTAKEQRREVKTLQDKIRSSVAGKPVATTAFFFYGIFLSKATRFSYSITKEPSYACVRNYITRGGYIVSAYEVDPKIGACLTGIVVDVPEEAIPDIDRLEAAYKRVTTATVQGETVQMYVSKDN